MPSLEFDLDLGCPCCAIPSAIAAIVAIFVVTKLFMFSFGSGQSEDTTGTKWLIIFTMRWLSRISFVIVALLAVFLGVLQQQPKLRSQFFAKLMDQMQRSEHLLQERCNLLSPLSGKVLEFGPGPGTNFKCMKDLPIDSWTGVEPNIYFDTYQAEAKAINNITFPTNTVWLQGGDVAVEPESFDVVVGTHLLCSVGDVEMVLKQAHRALKPGGTYYFLEHVSAPRNTIISYLQKAVSPFFYIMGNGCEFKETWTEILGSESLRGYEIDLRHFEADMMPIMSPQVIGTAVKPIQ
jgi:SAM-dependent methyltransferase